MKKTGNIIILYFRVELPCQVLCYNVPLTNNVMPVIHNEYKNMLTLMDSSSQNQGAYFFVTILIIKIIKMF